MCDEFGGSYSGARKYLSLAVAAGFILAEREKNLAFYTAAKNPKKPKQMPPKFGGRYWMHPARRVILIKCGVGLNQNQNRAGE